MDKIKSDKLSNPLIPMHTEEEKQKRDKDITEVFNSNIRILKEHTEGGFNAGGISDGYHTFKELYDHRIELFIKLCEYHDKRNELRGPYMGNRIVWKSKFHSDGSTFEGWFIMGIGITSGEQITYHIPNERWEDCDFATTLSKAPDFDGHTSNDVLQRLKEL